MLYDVNIYIKQNALFLIDLYKCIVFMNFMCLVFTVDFFVCLCIISASVIPLHCQLQLYRAVLQVFCFVSFFVSFKELLHILFYK